MAPPASETLRVGDRIGPYLLEEPLGEGGMGIVFRAVRDDGAVVALKVLRGELSHDETYRRLLLHEARAAGEVRHGHLVPVLDAGEAEDRSYLAVAYVSGRSLEERIQAEGPLQLPELVRLTSQVAAGLDALHQGDLVHRDIKPSNIMLDEEGNAALTDFGLAKGRAYTVLTKPGQVMGTLDYLAPELIRGAQATAQSDVYALGCVVFECLAGQAPFGEKAVFQVAVAHLEEEPPDPCRDREDCPDGLDWAVLRALEKDPTRRPTTATAYAQMIRLASGWVGPPHSQVARMCATEEGAMGERGRRFTTWMERAALGAIMGVVAFVVERRLRKAIRRRGEGPPETPRTAPTTDAELSAAPQDVDH
ncbi:MAG: serine/threonine-protein kinase [Actinomycetota bacterium]